MSEENILINPEDLDKPKDKVKRVKRESEEPKYIAKGNLVEINFESEGRFTLPDTMFFEDWNVDDIQELAVSNFDDLLETIVVILNKLKNSDCEISVSKATPSEFLEMLIGMKIKFDEPTYKHMWMCNCQTNKSEDDQIVSEDIIQLNDLKFKSITELDEDFKEKFKEVFEEMSAEGFKNYLLTKYKNNEIDVSNWSIEQELETIKVKEPINYKNNKNDKIYSFNLMRIDNVITAQEMVNQKYRPLLKSIQNRKNNGQPLDVFKAQKEEELKKIDKNKAKDIISYSEGLTLHAIDGKEIKSRDEKISLYKKLKRDDYFELENFLKSIDYGVYYDKKLRCPHCGDSEGRVLQQELNPFWLLPITPDSKDKGIKGNDGGLNIYFGI